ncbi:MAG: carboxyltransferase domain-containing protein [Pseudomonadota bacterium]
MNKSPQISRVGLRGVLVTFADTLSDAANRAAVAFRAEVEAQGWQDVQETASTLVSTFVAIDLTVVDYDDIVERLTTLLDGRDWTAVTIETDRKLWTIPMCFEPEVAPQLDDAAHAAGLSAKEARVQLSAMRTRVITLGFAPGQPYLGMLPDVWDIPRQTQLTPQVPIGALVVAIRQFVLFATSAPTGWRHIGQTAFRPFDPDREIPVAFSPGDEVRFAAITHPELSDLEATNSLGGAVWTPLS